MTSLARKPQTIDAASGDDVVVQHTVYSDEALTQVRNLASFTAKVVIADLNGTVVLSSEDSPPAVTITWPDRDNGVVQWVLAGAATDDLVGSYSFELQLADGSGKVRRGAYGYLNLPRNLIAA